MYAAAVVGEGGAVRQSHAEERLSRGLLFKVIGGIDRLKCYLGVSLFCVNEGGKSFQFLFIQQNISNYSAPLGAWH